MIEKKDKFTIKIHENSVEIINEEQAISFTAMEALMLLDILKNEEETLKQMSEKASPLPIRFKQ